MCQDLSPRPTAISLRPLLLIAEDEFSAALLKGDDAVVAFNERWERLLADIDSVSSKGLDDETSALVHTVATRIATLAEVAIDLYTTSNALTSELMEQLDSSMSTLSLVDTQQGEHIRSLSQPPLPILSPSKCSPHHRKRRRCSEDTDVHPHKRMRCVALVSLLHVRILIPASVHIRGQRITNHHLKVFTPTRPCLPTHSSGLLPQILVNVACLMRVYPVPATDTRDNMLVLAFMQCPIHSRRITLHSSVGIPGARPPLSITIHWISMPSPSLSTFKLSGHLPKTPLFLRPRVSIIISVPLS